MSQSASAPATAAADPRVGRLIVVAAVVGIAASLAAVLFMTAVHGLEHVVWTSIPEAAGWTGTPWWWVAGMLLTGAVLTWAACRLPGHGGHHPLDEFAFNVEGVAIVSVVLAALAALAFGAVVGPEAPLVAVGTATAGLLFRGDHPGERQIMLAAGGVAALGLILGNPLITAILVLEGAVVKGSPGGKAAMSTLMPAMVALGFGYLVQVGAGDWAGFGETILAVPGLPAYPDVQGVDLLAGIVVALVAGVLAVVAIRIGTALAPRADRSPLRVIVIVAVLVAVIVIAVEQLTGQASSAILFSGQAAIPQVLTLTSVGTLAVIAVGKALAYGLSIGSGFRGGRIFPAVYLGVVVGTGTAALLPSTNLSALVACGIAAGAGAAMRLPFTSALLAVLLCAAAGLAVTTSAIAGAVVGILVRAAADRIADRVGPADSTTPAAGPAQA